MTNHMAKSRRLLRLVHPLADTREGLTLDDMAAKLEVNRRTAERLRDVIRETFDLEELADDRRKRFRIPEACGGSTPGQARPKSLRCRPRSRR